MISVGQHKVLTLLGKRYRFDWLCQQAAQKQADIFAARLDSSSTDVSTIIKRKEKKPIAAQTRNRHDGSAA